MEPGATSQDSPKAVAVHRSRVGWAALVLAIILIVGWPVAAIVNWENIVSSHARLGYLVGDLGIVVPLGIAVWYGLRRQRPWGPLVFLFYDGAVAYDGIHFEIYLAQLGFLTIPLPIYLAAMVVSMALVAWLAWWELRVLLRRVATGP
jgi:hypothetical protein